MGFVVENHGFLTTIQDQGRLSWQTYGVSPSGFMDRRSASLANILVGNQEGCSLIEATAIGPVLKMAESCIITVTGAKTKVYVDGQEYKQYCALYLQRGQVLSFGVFESGTRLYIAFKGGVKVKEVMGSASTDVRFHFGGYQGRALKSGDEVLLNEEFNEKKFFKSNAIHPEEFSSNIELRVIFGPQDDVLTVDGWRSFLGQGFQIGPHSDRMGCRLVGPVIHQKGDGNILSQGTAYGSIQLPKNGQMIILMSERQTVGGYPEIAHVIWKDLPLLAQGKPGDIVRFKGISMELAQDLYMQEIDEMKSLS